jgi:hypothetical protein
VIDVLRIPLRQSDSARLANFHYDIEELLHLGAPHLAAATSRLKAQGSFAVLYARHDGVCTEPLPAAYFQLLEKLDGQQPAEKIAITLGISNEESRKFLRIALQEGIVIPVKS